MGGREPETTVDKSDLHSLVRGLERRRRSQLSWLAFASALAWISLLAIRRIEADEVGFIDVTLALLVIAAACLLVWPDSGLKLAARISEIGVGEIKVTLVAEAQSIAIDIPDIEDGARITERPKTALVPLSLELIRSRLERHLLFVRDAVLKIDETSSPEQVADRLRAALLSEQEWEVTRLFLGLAETEVFKLPKDNIDSVLDGAWTWASRVHAEIADRHARKELREAGWQILDFDQPRGHRREFLGQSPRGDWRLIAVRPADPPQTALVKTAKRLADLPDEHEHREHRAFRAVADRALRGPDMAVVAPEHLHKESEPEIEDIASQYKARYGGLEVVRLGKLIKDGS